MSNIFKKALTLFTGDDVTLSLKIPKTIRPLKRLTERELIQLESEIGRNLFGPIPEGHRREFFNLDKKTWIWHEEYTDSTGVVHATTTRYEVKDTGILKAQDGLDYSYVDGEELRNLMMAIHMYYERVTREVYGRDPRTGQKLPE